MVIGLDKKFQDILLKKIPHINPRTWKIYEGFDFIVVLAGSYTFRFPKNRESIAKIKTERKVLKYLKNKITLSIPNYQEEKDEPNLFYYKTIIGEELSPYFYRSLSEKKKNKICQDLAKFMIEVHSLSIPKNILSIVSKDNWSKIYKEIEKDITNNLSSDKKTENFLASFKNFISKPRKLCFVHGDLSGDNIIINLDKQKIEGIIDFGDIRFSDPVVDFAHFWSFGEEMVNKVINFYTKNKIERQSIFEDSRLYYEYIMFVLRVIKRKKGV